MISSHKQNIRSSKTWPQVASIIVMVVGCLVLVGWVFNIPVLKSVLPGLATMKANTAVCFVLVGVGLWLLRDKKASQRQLSIARICALVVISLGLLRLGEHFTGWDFSIDQLVFSELSVQIDSSIPDRMAYAAAFSFILLGVALLLLNNPKRIKIVQLASLIVVSIGLLALVGYFYDVADLYEVFAYSSLSLHTAITLLIAGMGILLARPKQGVIAVITADTPTSMMGRRLLPAVILMLFLAGWFPLQGKQWGLYQTKFELAVFALAIIGIFAVLVWSTVNLLNKAEAKRKQADEHILRLNRTLSVLSDINQSIVRIRDLPTLYKAACEIAVEKGAFRVAWIGLVDHETRQIKPVGHAGMPVDLVPRLTIDLDNQLLVGAPSITAFNTGVRVIVNNIETDLARTEWRETARRMGFESSAALPLIVNGEVHGVFHLFAREPGFFDTEELRLVDEIADDIAFAMTIAEQEGYRQQAEEALLESEGRYHQMLNDLLEGCQILSHEWRYLFVNEVNALQARVPRSKLQGNKITEVFPGFENTPVYADLKRSMEERIEQRVETEFFYADGSSGWFQLSIQPVPEGILILTLDITERKQSEIAVRRYTQRMEVLHEIDMGIINASSTEVIVETALKNIRLLIPCQATNILLINETMDEAIIYAVDKNTSLAFDKGSRIKIVPERVNRYKEAEITLIDDFRLEPVIYPLYQERINEGLLSLLTVSLSAQGHWMGLLTLMAEEVGFFKADYQEIATQVAGQLAIAIHQLQLRDALHQSEERYREVVENQTDFICRYQPDFTITFVNDSYEDLYKDRSEALLGVKFFDLMPDKDRIEALDKISQLGASHPVTTSEHRSLLPDGTIRWIQWTSRVLLDDAEQIAEYQAVGRDITEHKINERELKSLYDATSYLFMADSLQTLGRQIVAAVIHEFEQVDCGLMLLDKTQNKIIRLARSGAYDIQPESTLTVDGPGLVPLALRTGSTIYVPNVDEDSRYLLSDARTKSEIVIPLKTANGIMGVLDLQSSKINAFSDRDQRILLAYVERAAPAIENRQLYEEINQHAAVLESRVAQRTAEVSASRDRVEAILNNSTDGILLAFVETGIQQSNAMFNTLFACEDEDYLTKPLESLVREEDRHQLIATIQSVITTQKGENIEVLALRKDGTFFGAELGIGYMRTDENREQGVVCVIRDITKRKQAEQEFQVYLKELHDISIELTQIDQLDDFYRRAVEFGLRRLGFERIAIFLYNESDAAAVGTYGTDTDGNIIDEHNLIINLKPNTMLSRLLNGAERFNVEENVTFFHDNEPVEVGWYAAAVLLNGKQNIGWLVADNYIYQRPASKPLLDTLALYAMTIGSLLARKQTEAAQRESEARYRLLADNISDVIVRTSNTGIVEYVSPSSEIVLGYTPEELVGSSGRDLIDPNAKIPSLAELMAAFITNGGTTSLSFPFEHKEGHSIWLEAVGQMILSSDTGEFHEFIASIRDITERKRAEEAVRQALEKEKELSDLKSRFVSMASHEFRTPLANILAMTETLTHYRHKMVDTQIADRLNNITGQVDRLKDIMDDVLQLARIQAKRVEFNPLDMDLNAFCKEIINEFQLRSDVHQRLDYTCLTRPPVAKLDKKLMHHIIDNLLSNAIKYSPKDKPITIQLKHEDDNLVLTISDQGIGIPESDLKHLFEPFHRAANVGTISGTGLGLVITKESVELHGGTISTTSFVDKGTTMIVTIPVMNE